MMPHFVLLLVVSCFILNCSSEKIETDQLVIVILSQANSYHQRQAKELREDIYHQCGKDEPKPIVLFLHEEWHGVGGWTTFPTFERISTEYGSKAKWVVYVDEFARLNLEKLVETLSQFDSTKEHFVGHALIDKSPTIIHHYHGFSEGQKPIGYPLFAAGFAMTLALISSSSARLQEPPAKQSFYIDAQHELAAWLWKDGEGVGLTSMEQFCSSEPKETSHDCAIWPVWSKRYSCNAVLDPDNVLFAVKTTKKFHDERLSVIKRTWADDAKHVIYFSETADESVPTRGLNVNNTETGHCAKMMAILEAVHEDSASYPWVAVVDDDTLLSVPRLLRLLSCYDPNEPVAIGERYGFAVLQRYGYNYLTGGAGMVLSNTLLKIIVDGGRCSCSVDNSPDDMILGMCFHRIGMPIVHSPLFHQARPADYASDYLAHQRSVSFHKFYGVDPLQVYQDWLRVGGSLEHDEL